MMRITMLDLKLGLVKLPPEVQQSLRRAAPLVAGIVARGIQREAAQAAQAAQPPKAAGQ